jgi:hypothetical protein
LYALNQYEVDYHPLTYKGQMCEYEGSCSLLGQRCYNAHGLKDLRNIGDILTKLRTNFKLQDFSIDIFKAIECPNKDSCISVNCFYYHNEFERRRLKQYENTLCPSVNDGVRYLHPDNCKEGEECKYCHTKNELRYHPLNYKKQVCKRVHCTYGSVCSDIHINELSLTELKATKEMVKKENENLSKENVLLLSNIV